MNQVIKLNGTTIKTPRPNKFKVEYFNLTKASRRADGSMNIQFIAQKRKFYFSYDVINSTDLTVIENIIRGTTMSISLSYVENNVTKTADVYVGNMPKTFFRSGSKWYYTDVTFDLIEL